MKQFLSILVVALFMTACQSGTSESSVEAEANAIPAFNPAHGQPHHDCALSVGAPLVVKDAAKTPEGKPVKLNPEHGEPGHSCSVAVGAPLI